MLYGRATERAALEQLLDDARRGDGGVLVLRGEAGVGKSALLAHTETTAAGMTLLRAQGVTAECELPWAGLHQLLRPLLDGLEALPRPQRDALAAALGLRTGASEPFLVGAAVLGLLADAAEAQPLLLLVDDAQWLDRPSAEALLFAARRLGADRVAVVLGVRDPDERSLATDGLPALHVAGLDDAAAADLLAARGDDLPRHVRERLVAGTGGNPLALLVLPEALSAEERSGRAPLDDPLPVTAELERAFFARTTRLPADAQRLMLLAAAEETGDAAVVLRGAAQAGIGEDAAAPLAQAGLLTLTGGRVAFRHPLVRSAVYHHAALHERRAAHAALAGALGGEALADRRAWHRAAAAEGPDEAVAAELARGAQRARHRGGHAAAARALERAAALSPDEGDRADRLVAAAEAASLAGDGSHALALLEGTEGLRSTPGRPARSAHVRGQVELRRGEPEIAHELLLTGAADPGAAVGERLWMLVLAGEAASYAANTAGMIAVGEHAARLRPDTPVESFMAELLAGIGLVLRGELERGLPILREVVDAADAFEDPRHLVVAGAAAAYIGAYDVTPRLYARAVERARAEGALGALAYALEFLAHVEAWEDRHALALAHAGEGLALAQETGQRTCAAHHHALLAFVASAQGREADCRAHAAAALDDAGGGWVLQGATAYWALALLDLSAGRPREACERFDAIDGSLWRRHELIALYALPDRVEALVRCGERAHAEQALASFAAWARTTEQTWALALLARCEGLLAQDPERARERFGAALALHVRSGRPLQRARTALCLGEALRREGARREARVQLRDALEAFERLDAALWAERAREELRASGESARPRDDHAARDALTPQETQVAGLVAEGLTNRAVAERLFLSPKTVEYHLSKVYSKLEIASRAELIRLRAAAAAAD